MQTWLATNHFHAESSSSRANSWDMEGGAVTLDSPFRLPFPLENAQHVCQDPEEQELDDTGEVSPGRPVVVLLGPPPPPRRRPRAVPHGARRRHTHSATALLRHWRYSQPSTLRLLTHMKAAALTLTTHAAHGPQVIQITFSHNSALAQSTISQSPNQ